MKKLMIAAAIVCATVAAQAATYAWNSTGSAYWSSSESWDDFSGYKVYAFDANTITMAALTESLATKGADDLAMALGYGSVDGFEYRFSGTGITDDGGDPTKYINGYLVLVSSDVDGKQYFNAQSIAPIEVTDGIIGGGAPLNADFIMDNLPGAGADGWTQVAAVPEPTSGLLLLLGMAGLALRRRRA